MQEKMQEKMQEERTSKYFRKNNLNKIKIKYEHTHDDDDESSTYAKILNKKKKNVPNLYKRCQQRPYNSHCNNSNDNSNNNGFAINNEVNDEHIVQRVRDISTNILLKNTTGLKKKKNVPILLTQTKKKSNIDVKILKDMNKRKKCVCYEKIKKRCKNENSLKQLSDWSYKKEQGEDHQDENSGQSKNGSDSNKDNTIIELKKKHFVLTYNKIKKMRENLISPVDKYGCHMLSEKTNDLKLFRFQILISCFLSSRTKDEVTAKVMERLKKHGLTVTNILNTPLEKLKELLYGVGFYNVKAKQIFEICHILKNKYNSDIPHTYEELMKLPGIGEKMTQLILQTALNKHEGIAVDIHVHRIANRLNWVKTNKELITQIELKKYVDKHLWSELNHLLVGFGQIICKAQKPLCEKCTLTNYCQYYKDSIVKKKKVRINYVWDF
ncbi:endonuclease III-like protein 1, putative [Hepatocystis sp. ex Piliocolobus tephrosceles]|nr:endonuclease III-like protein 1, putative [Hepatocystis sp. ex Piliocolobus tephrosceles]